MLRWLRGYEITELEGACPEDCLNRWTRRDIPFWRLRRISEFQFHCCLYHRDLAAAETEAGRAQCTLLRTESRGLPVLLDRLFCRPVLTIGVILAVLLAMYAQNFVWFLQVSGNETIPAETILRALEEEGLHFGSWGPSMQSERLKNRVLNRISGLRWLAVNRSGGIVTVLVAEREPELPIEEKEEAAHLVARRSGIIREMRVLNGFAQVEPGDVVLEGDLLISGTAEWNTNIQVTRAAGEVYADTIHAIQLICPDASMKKVYTGRVERCYSIIFKRKRRKISGNSGIFGGMCDRMIETRGWTLPGGFSLPFLLETSTIREYRLVPQTVERAEASELLDSEALRLTRAEMIAGQVDGARSTLQKTKGGYCCRAVVNSLELISGTVPVELFGEETDYGKTDQRRTD